MILASVRPVVVCRKVFGYTRRSYEASWRNGYAEDCKSLNGGSIPSEASNFFKSAPI
jgi:hypothetical protein